MYRNGARSGPASLAARSLSLLVVKMAQISTTEDQKYDYEEAERAVIPEKSEQFKHGDRALALVGDETIELTEEEVRQRRADGSEC